MPPQRRTTRHGVPARCPRDAETAWAKLRNFAQSSSQCQGNFTHPALHAARAPPTVAVAIQSIANHSAFPELIILGELSAGSRTSPMIGH
jgi:hypothetical protein